MKIKLFATTVVFIALGGCASLGPKGQPAELNKVKKIAIVGFELVQQEPKSFEISLGASESTQSPQFASSISAESPHAEDVYNVLREAIRKDLAWVSLSVGQIKSNLHYKAAFNKQMKGIRSIPPAPAESQRYLVTDIIDWWAVERLSSAERAVLAKSLGVDAVMVVRAYSQLIEGFSFKKLYGGGNFKSQVGIEIKLYAADGENIIWSDGTLKGEPTHESTGHFAGISGQESINKLVVQGARLGAEKLKESYNTVKNQK